jgi:endonuclease V-like protein UPF0215 family
VTHVHRPHLLGIDDGPFEKGAPEVAIVGVMMEGRDLVEGVAVTHFPADGADVTAFLADWIAGLRFRPALQGIVLGGITIAGLAIIDVAALAERTATPVLAVSRRNPRDHRLAAALRAAGLTDRQAIVDRTPPAFALADEQAPRQTGLEREGGAVFVACAGVRAARAAELVRSSRSKADLPEPLRLAHLIARALVTGESHGRV